MIERVFTKRLSWFKNCKRRLSDSYNVFRRDLMVMAKLALKFLLDIQITVRCIDEY